MVNGKQRLRRGKGEKDFTYLEIPIESSHVHATGIPPMIFQSGVVDDIDHGTHHRRWITGDPIEKGLQPALGALAMTVQIREDRGLRSCRAE